MIMNKKILMISIFGMLAAGIQTTVAKSSNSTNNEEAHHYTLEVVDMDNVKPSNDAQEHFLGSSITPKWNTFLYNYVHQYENSVGFSNSLTEVSKPSVYHAVMKVNKFIKKEIKEGKMSTDEAIRDMGHVLDCANAIIENTDTENIERDLAKYKDADQLITFFSHIEIKKI